MAGPASVDAYLGAVPDTQRVALEKLRKTIRSAAPDAVETISYQMPAFKLNGRFLVSYAAFKDHCSLFPGSAVPEELRDDVKPFVAGKGTLRFSPEKPIPAALVKKIVKTRIREIEAKRAQKGK
ncbi:MAG TPA: DUF1801 domain-containing protein [Actinomycetota bacterium]|nr:DUF1801 domain-containing protein [Actinomycetota bacterium]